MKYKKITVLAIFLVSLLAISAVSAADNATSDVVSVEKTTADVVKETTDEVVSAEDNQVILGNESDVGTFDELSSLIENASEGTILELDKNYQNNGSVSSDGITITKALTIDGKGHTLDADGKSRIFYITAANVALKNIIFKNGYNNGDGGAVYFSQSEGKVVGCSFENCSSSKDGGAVYFYEKNNLAENSSFVNCSAMYGGAIYINQYWYESSENYNLVKNCSFRVCSAKAYGAICLGADELGRPNLDVIGCSFIKCSAQGNGGALNCPKKIVNCIFMNCSAKNGGAFFLFYYTKNRIDNCTFVNCSANTYGGAIYNEGSNSGNVTNCTFRDCYAEQGGAVYFDCYYDMYGYINGCNDYMIRGSSFFNCSSSQFGGAIALMGNDTLIDNCSFVDCSSNQGGAICLDERTYYDDYSNYVHLKSYRDNVINCDFVNSSSTTLGGAVYWNAYDGRIENSNFTRSHAKNGGAVYVERPLILNVSSSKFENNVADELGSAIYFNILGNVDNCILNGNTDPEIYSLIDPSGSTFTVLQFLIDNASEGDVLELDKDYQNNGSESEITISKSMTIDGKGHILDAKSASRIFYISGYSAEVTLKNMTFRNGFSNGGGGGILSGSEGVIVNCSFINCTVKSDSKGGGLNGGRAYNCSFINCTADDHGGGLASEYAYGCLFINCTADSRGGGMTGGNAYESSFVNCKSNHVGGGFHGGDAYNCTFTDCYASDGGGGISDGNGHNCTFINCTAYVFGGGGIRYGEAHDCYFENCSSNYGGAIHVDVSSDINNCIFINCQCSGDGGAINTWGEYINVTNCKFVGCYGSNGGAIYIEEINNNIVAHSNFTGCFANNGGAIYVNSNSDNSTVYDCRFMDCHADNYGGCIFWNADDGRILDSDFTNSRAKIGGAVYMLGDNSVILGSIFTNSTADENGGAVYWKGKNGTIEDSSFTSSHAVNGGAVYVDGNVDVAITDSRFENNAAEGLGGAVYGGNVLNCNLSGNTEPQISNSSQSRMNTTTMIEVNVSELNFGENISITVNVFDQNDDAVSGNVDLYINSALVESVEIGETFTYSPSEPGDFIVEARFNETSNYTGSSNYASFTVLPKSSGNESSNVTPVNPKSESITVVLINATSIYLGDSIAVTVSVLDSNNQTVDGNVEVFVNSTSIGLKTIGEVFTYSPTEVGDLIVEARFNETSNYTGSSNYASFTVLPKSGGNESSNVTPQNPKNQTRTMLLVNSANVYLGDNVTVTAIVSNQNSEMLAGTVDVYVNSTFIGSKNINEAFAYAPDKIGKYIIEARFNETSDYNASSARVTVNVIENIVPEEITSDDDGIVILEFPDDAEGTLTVFIDGVKYKVYDITGGILKIDLSYKKGKYNITFEYSGDKKYPAFKKDTNASIQTNPSIKASNAKVLYSAGTIYKITVYKNKGILAKSVSVTIKLNNKKLKPIKTNSKGIASFKVTQPPGTYKLKITSLGKTVTKTLTVKHIVTLKTVTVKKSAKKLILQATLAKVNKKYLKKKTVTFKFNGKKYKAKTNAKGVAKVTIKSSVLKKLKVGKKVTYQATYLKDTVKKTAKVKK